MSAKLLAVAVLLLCANKLALAQSRPQLVATEAAKHKIVTYLTTGNGTQSEVWQPEALSANRTVAADFIVSAQGQGTHLSVQSALDALPASGATTKRHTIRILAGTYREQICLRDKAPVTLLGDATDAASVVIVAGHYNGEAKRPGLDAANPCVPDLAAANYGTAGSTSVALFGDGIQLINLTIQNDAMDQVRNGDNYPPGAGESGGAQAVALTLQGDRIQLENVRLLGHQDTLYVRARPGAAAARIYVRNSLIAGDVDFIFGNATLVIDHSIIKSRAGRRKPGNGGHVLAPSTAHDATFGFLVTNSRFCAEPGLRDESISLGRAWDFGVAAGTWQAGSSPNGAAVIRDSLLGPHIGAWAASTSRRPFSHVGEQANRMFEYNNAIAGSGLCP